MMQSLPFFPNLKKEFELKMTLKSKKGKKATRVPYPWTNKSRFFIDS